MIQNVLKMNYQIANTLIRCVPKWVYDFVLKKNEIIFCVSPQNLIGLTSFLKNHMEAQYKILIDVTAVDYPSRKIRFEVVYNLLSIHFRSRIRIKTFVDEITPIPSVTPIFFSAGWWEREVWDSAICCT